MNIIVAETSGFCFGVKQAVDTAYKMIDQNEKISSDSMRTAPKQTKVDPDSDRPLYMFGNLIHNQTVVNELVNRGMKLARQLEDIPDGAKVLIRAHGVKPEVISKLREKNCEIIDRTCPYVKKIHRIVLDAWQDGKKILIAGTQNHPEVVGINGECHDEGIVLRNASEAEKYEFPSGNFILVAQTTFSVAEFREIGEVLKKKIAKLEIFDTICITTDRRQKEAASISSRVDMMFVLGSTSSSNTQKLLEVCSSRCGETHLIEYPEQVKSVLKNRDTDSMTIGIIAGASTPERIIREVIHAMTEKEVMQNQQEQEQEKVQEQIQEQAVENVQEQETTEAVQDNAEETVAVEAEETVEKKAEETVEAKADDAVEAKAEEAAEAKEADAGEVTEAKAEEAVETQESQDESVQEQADISFTDFIDNIPQLKRGATVKGVIVRYDNDNVYVDVKDKSEGRIPRHEFDGDPDFDLDKAIEEHIEIDVYVRNIRNSDFGKEIVLSKARVDFGKYKALIEDAYNEKTPITVKVVNVVKDGVIASYGGVDIYVHRTQLEMGIVDDLEPYRGQTLDILVTQYDPDKKRLRVSGSRRALLATERKKKAEEIWDTIEVGNDYQGIVRSLTDFGAFVDIGGVDGLVHVSELSWKRIRHPSDVVSVGDEIKVFVKDFDKDRKRISLGYKKAEDDPYHDVESRFPVGSIVRGIVVRMFPFGAFVEIAPGVDALCHISQISDVRLTKPNDVLSEGMEIDARVLEVSNESRRISISIKEVEPINPEGYDASEHEAQQVEGFDNQAELDQF